MKFHFLPLPSLVAVELVQESAVPLARVAGLAPPSFQPLAATGVVGADRSVAAAAFAGV